ncbi:hypothetical protein RSOLAG1IB_10281 [Rhizoctonia solani AG-1 IB]|uniref:Heme peroxidase n=1 Tax=Thanatephorus cucumeris (strain AG1-IB / isolate 7/3/14) TaxID=1108050 RepID=A0A0B7FZC0_THACB|nr:hypothetical protein RSOLAG1IB_10281 [Rhizoctonia solani AG-1 IB]
MSARTNGISDEDIARVEAMVARIASGTELLDDRRGLMPQAFGVLSQIPPENPAGLRINNHLIRLLYQTIPHPVDTLLGEDRFRQADGSRNNIFIPSLGQAGMPYARTCQGRHPLPIPSLPDAGLVFDGLLKATGKRADHPGKNSSLTFAFAAIVTHSLFRTDPRDWNKNNTSSYFDLSPLYGSNQEEQNAVRIKDGRGRLYPDTFSEGRLVFLPPASAALLVIWSRNHNYIADTILAINEQGRWKNPPSEDLGERAAQDEEIFQTARLINCGSFMSVILGDYVAGFLGLGRNGSSWSMQPFDPFKDPNNQPVGRGQGNHVSVEFNVLYRWHPVTSDEDEKWSLGLFKKLFGDRSLGDLTLADFYDALGRLKKGGVHPDLIVEPEPRKRIFGGIKRGTDGRFSDDDLAYILQNSTESVAHRYGARGTPEVFKVIEILGIEQARRWGVCSMNEFRIRMGLKPFATFEEWNRDPNIANAAKKLYGTIDNLELYAGLHAEETMPLGTGSGLCAGYTITRAILSDAIALIRGDRFFTTDFTPTNLTAWGIQDVARDPNNGAFGAYLPKLLMRALPRHYPHDSVYSLFPFFTPSATKENLTRLKLADKYDFERPTATSVPVFIKNISGMKHILDDTSRHITNKRGDPSSFSRESEQMLHALFSNPEGLENYSQFYRKTIQSLIRDRSIIYDNAPGAYINIIADVINPAVTRWVCEYVLDISLKSRTNSDGDLTEQDLYQAITAIYSYVYLPSEPHSEWAQKIQAKRAADMLIPLIKSSIERISQPKRGVMQFTQRIVYAGLLRYQNEQSTPFECLLKKLLHAGKTLDDVASLVLGVAVRLTVGHAQAIAHTVDFYLHDQYRKELGHIVDLSLQESDDSLEILAGYYREARRLAPQSTVLLRLATGSQEIAQDEGLTTIRISQDDLFFCSYQDACLSPELFPCPTRVDPHRSKEGYFLHGAEIYHELSDKVIPEVMKELFGLRNLRRAPGLKGYIRQMTGMTGMDKNKLYLSLDGTLSVLPTSLTLVYDSELDQQFQVV